MDHSGESSPSRQCAPQQLEPPLNASTSPCWDPRGLAGCAVSALGSEQHLQHLLSKVLNFLLPEKQLLPAFQVWPKPLLLPVIPESKKPIPPLPLQSRLTAGLQGPTQQTGQIISRESSLLPTICRKFDLLGPQSHFGGEVCRGL